MDVGRPGGTKAGQGTDCLHRPTGGVAGQRGTGRRRRHHLTPDVGSPVTRLAPREPVADTRAATASCAAATPPVRGCKAAPRGVDSTPPAHRPRRRPGTAAQLDRVVAPLVRARA